MRHSIVLSLLLSACAAAGEPTPESSTPMPGADTPAPIAGQTRVQGAPHRAGTVAQIEYHGGYLVTWDVPVYIIYYGGWLDDHGNWGPLSGEAWLLEKFTGDLAGSSWFSINRWYGSTNRVHVAGRTVDRYSLGTQLSGDNVRWIVENAIWNRSLPNDPWGIYVVLPTPDVDQDGFCVNHCGWHTYTQWGNESLLYSFVGNSERCPNVCGVYTPSPNDNPVADAMVSVLGHELSETVTDPHLDGWSDANGEENADKCAWNFGATFSMSNGSVANVAIGDRYYLVQQNWAPANPGYCAQGAF